MRAFMIVAGVASLTLGVLLCVVAGWVVWDFLAVAKRPASAHLDFAGVTIGAFTFSGWHVWAVVAGLALIGVLLILLALYAFQPSHGES